MCTVSWRLDADGYELLFNRDELRTRAEGLSPSRHEAANTGFVAPIDPDGGGTWIAANQEAFDAQGLFDAVLAYAEEAKGAQ